MKRIKLKKLKKKKINTKLSIILFIIVIGLVLSYMLINYISKKINPFYMSYAETEVNKILTEIINNSVTEEVEKEMAKLREEFIADNPDFDENNEEWKEKLEQYINEDKMYYTYEEFNDYDYIEYETFVDTFETPQGEKVVSFGYYG